MSADDYTDCPICKHKNCVRIDGIYDYILKEDRIIDTKYIRGTCSMCGNGFGEYKGDKPVINDRQKGYHDCERERCPK